MARFFPAELPTRVHQDPLRSAEIKVFDALRQQLSSAGAWTVFYSVAWLGRRGGADGGAARDGETDFIVAHPDHGILLIEVKGGRIGYDGAHGQWTTMDRRDARD